MPVRLAIHQLVEKNVSSTGTASVHWFCDWIQSSIVLREGSSSSQWPARTSAARRSETTYWSVTLASSCSSELNVSHKCHLWSQKPTEIVPPATDHPLPEAEKHETRPASDRRGHVHGWWPTSLRRRFGGRFCVLGIDGRSSQEWSCKTIRTRRRVNLHGATISTSAAVPFESLHPRPEFVSTQGCISKTTGTGQR